MRAKGDGRDCNRKWFTGEIFQRFVEGGPAGLSPGLAANIKAIFDIIYVRAPVPEPVDPSAAGKNKTAKNGGGGAKKRKGGHTMDNAAAAAPAAAAAAAAPAAAAAAAPGVSPADDTALDSKLRQLYGSHMDIVKLGLTAWQKLGLLYAEWREPWTSRTTDYAEERVLKTLRCAIALSNAMKACSVSKHKSWYFYLTVWAVPRQMAVCGDLWAMGTAPVEQRGARLKKFIRNVVSWRPFHDGMVQPAGPAEQNGTSPAKAFVARRKYERAVQ